MRLLVTVFTFVVLLTSGCTHEYLPKPDTYEFRPIPEFTSAGEIELINYQPKADNVLIGSVNGHKFYADLQKWTDIAIIITKRELTKRGLQVKENTNKKIKMAISSTRSTCGNFGCRNYTTLQVETSSGYKGNYSSEGPAMSLAKASDAAVIRAVEMMLKDNNIVEYIEQ